MRKYNTGEKISFANMVRFQSEDEEFCLNEVSIVEAMVNTDTIIAIPVGPRSIEKKTVRCLLDLCVTSSLMDPVLCEENLSKHPCVSRKSI